MERVVDARRHWLRLADDHWSTRGAADEKPRLGWHTFDVIQDYLNRGARVTTVSQTLTEAKLDERDGFGDVNTGAVGA